MSTLTIGREPAASVPSGLCEKDLLLDLREKLHSSLQGSRTGFVAMTEQQSVDLRKAYASAGWRGFLQKRAEFLLENRKRNYVPASILAGQYARLGDKEKALEWLERAVAERDEWVTYMNVSPDYDELHADPRFADLLRRIGLPP